MIEFYGKALTTGYCDITFLQSTAIVVPILVVYIMFLIMIGYFK